MMNGIGIHGVYPPLAGADSLINDKARLIKSILEGVQGSTVIKGVEYNGEMQSNSLTDQQVSDLLNYIRNSWSNEREAVLLMRFSPLYKKVRKVTETALYVLILF